MKLFKYPLSYLIGLKFYHKKNWNTAANFFQKTLNSSPNNAHANFKLGMCYFKQKQWDLAYQYIEKAVQLLPEKNEWKVQFYQSQMRLSHLPTKLTTTSSAIKEALIRSQIENGQNTPELYSSLADILGKQGKYWQEIDVLEKAIDLESNNHSLYKKLLKPLMEMKRYEEFIDVFNKLNSKEKISEYKLWYQAGLCYQKINLEYKAEEAFQIALNLENSPDSKNFGIGYLHEKQGLWHEAVQSYLQQLKIMPLNSDLYQKIGFAYQRCYEWINADKYYRLAIELVLSNGSEINPELYYKVAVVNERAGNYEESIKFYQKALEIKYTSYWYYRLGMVFLASSLYEQATIAFLKTKKDFNSFDDLWKNNEHIDNQSIQILINSVIELIKNDATDSNTWISLAKLYLRNSELDNAEWAYKNAVYRASQYNKELYYEYGLILARLQKYKDAAECLLNIQQLNKAYGLPRDKFNNNEGFRKVALYNEYYDTLKIKENVILFESFMGISMSCNPFAIFLHMHTNPAYSNYLFVWAINDIHKIDDKFKKYENVIFIQKDSDAYLRYLCSAKFLINNATFPPYFIRKPEQLYLNTWHGTPWKTLGKDIKNGFMELKNTERNFLQSTHMLSPNSHTSWVLMDRYDIKEIYSGKLLEAGYPRIDLTLNASDEQKNKLYKQLGIDINKKTILYAPTWRGTSLASPEVESEKLINEINQLAKLNVNLLFRGHYFVENHAYDLGMGEFIVPEYINTNELLSIVDVLITDYSSIGFDYMVTGKPIIYYIDDYVNYKEERGLYFEAETLPGKLVNNIDELLEAVDTTINSNMIHPLYKEAQQKFVPYEDGSVTQKVVDWFILNQAQPNEIQLKHDKKSLLFFGGEFLPNGITTSLINLLSNIDKDKFVVSLLIDPDAIARDEKRLQQFARLPSDVHIIPRVGRMNRSIEDDWIEYKINQYRFIPETMKPYFEKAYSRDFQRIVGDTQFDAVIEFNGYNKFWSYLLGSANLPNAVKSIYQHNDLYGEWKLRFPQLENTFNAYYLFDNLISVSKSVMELNQANLVPLFSLEMDKFVYCDNVQNPTYVLESARAEIPEKDRHLFIKDNNEKIFINLARLSPEKGQEKLIRSFQKLVSIYPNAKLLILGDGPLKQKLNYIIRELSLENHVFLLGNQFNPFPFVNASDCFVLSSDYEGQSIAVLEAMILGKPVIATDVVGVRSAVEGRPGYLVENTEAGLFEGMKDFIEGKLSFDKFDYEAYQKQSLEMFYHNILN